MQKIGKVMQFAIVFSIIVMLVGCGIPKNEHETLKKQYARVQQEMTAYNERANNVSIENQELEAKVVSLQNTIKKLKMDNEKRLLNFSNCIILLLLSYRL